MIRGLYSSARGMAVEQIKQDVISSNLANSTTAGYKKDTVVVQSFAESLARVSGGQAGALGAVSQSPLIQTIHTDFTAGMPEETGRSLDLALTGDAFFTVRTPEGIRYTRDGSFSRDGAGYLVTRDGYFVLDENGEAIRIDNDSPAVDTDGGIRRQNGGQEELTARLGLAVFAPEDLAGLVKRGHNLFEAAGVAPVTGGAGQVRQYMLERANVDILREMIDMLSVLRIYEANQKSLQAQDEMLGKSVNDVGRLR